MLKVKLSKIVTGILVCAVISLFYVHQEVERVKTGFLISERLREVAFLLDRHRSLVYNLSKLESPGNIEEALSANEIAVYMRGPTGGQGPNRIMLAYDTGAAPETKRQPGFLARMFDRISTNAEAKVVK